MKNLDRYLKEVKKGIPDIETRLNAGADESRLEQLARNAGGALPAQLLGLYRRFDGEDMAKGTGFLAGMQFLPLEKALADFAFFQGLEDEMTAMGTDAVREEPLSRLTWIPIAYDCARAWLVVDLTPAEGGTAGQVTALDYDTDQCWLLADSLDGLFGKMTDWLRQGILTIDTESFEEPMLMERSGHLFNSLEELTTPVRKGTDPLIPLPEGFWQRYYGQQNVPLSCLENEKIIRIQNEDVDCALFAHMSNLKELILHGCSLTNADGLAKAPKLKKLIFAGCDMKGDQLSVLSKAPALKELGVNVMSAAGLPELKGLKSLRSLRLRKVTDFVPEELAGFAGLWELSYDSGERHGGMFLEKLKNLKRLDLHHNTLDNLDFLAGLTKLTQFHLAEPAGNENGLAAVRGLANLKEFIYPVKDLSVYKGHPALESIGIASGARHGFEAFEGSRVNGFTVLGRASDEELKSVREQMEKYVKIYSYGSESM